MYHVNLPFANADTVTNIFTHGRPPETLHRLLLGRIYSEVGAEK